MRNPLSTTPAGRRPRRRLIAALAAASMAVTGGVAVTAQADSTISLEPVPTPVLTPTPKPTLPPSYGTLCGDPAPGAVATTYKVVSVTSTTAVVRWSMGFGCFKMPITAKLDVDGVEYAKTVGGQYTLGDEFTVTGLEPASTHHLKVTSSEWSDTGARVLGESDVTTLAADPSSTPAPPTPGPSPSFPTPTPTPLPPTPTPSFPVHAPVVDHIDVSELTPTSATLTWGRTVADPLYYVITVSGYPPIAPQKAGTTTLTGLNPGTTYTVRVSGAGAYASGGNTFTIELTTPNAGPTPTPIPSGPTPTSSPLPAGQTVCNEIGPPASQVRYTIEELTPTTARIFYQYGAGCFTAPITGTYELDGQVKATLSGFTGTYTFTGLQPGSTHRVKITGNAGGSDGGIRILADLDITTPLVAATPSPAPTPKISPTSLPTPVPTLNPSTCQTPGVLDPDSAFIDFPFKAAGTATLKTLTKGSIPLTGILKAKVCLPSSTLTGDLTLDPAAAKLTALGFLPVAAKVNLVQTEKFTGSIRQGAFSVTAKLRIKLPSVKVLGVELAGGANCQAKQISSITLKNTQATFVPVEGGPVGGTFSISDLTGCGGLTGLVSPLTSGSGNAIALNLTPPTF